MSKVIIPATKPKFQVMVYGNWTRPLRYVGSRSYCETVRKAWYQHGIAVGSIESWPME